MNAKRANRQISNWKNTRNGVVEQGRKRGQQGMTRALGRIDRLAITYSGRQFIEWQMTKIIAVVHREQPVKWRSNESPGNQQGSRSASPGMQRQLVTKKRKAFEIERKGGNLTNVVVEVHKERRNGAGKEEGSAGNDQGRTRALGRIDRLAITYRGRQLNCREHPVKWRRNESPGNQQGSRSG